MDIHMHGVHFLLVPFNEQGFRNDINSLNINGKLTQQIKFCD